MHKNMSVEQLEAEIEAVAIDGQPMSAELHRRLFLLVEGYNPNLPLILKTFSWVKETGLPYDGLDIISGGKEISFHGYETSVFALARQLAHVDDEEQPKDVILRMMGRTEPVITCGARVYQEFSDEPVKISNVRGIHPSHHGFYFAYDNPEDGRGYLDFRKITHIVPDESIVNRGYDD